MANFYYPVPKARNHFEGQPCSTYGDVDNLTKLILDVLQSAGAFVNDRQVYALQVTKRYSQNARTDVEVTEVKPERDKRLEELTGEE
jgi:Holliday junction resolvase RusA-like endonuclease